MTVRVWMLDERFVLLQLTLCKTRYSCHRKYIRNNPVIILFLIVDTAIPSREMIPWRPYGRPSRKAALEFLYALTYLFVVQINAGIYERDRPTSRISTTAVHGRWSRDYQLSGHVIWLCAEWQSATMCYHIIIIDHFIILTYDSLSQMCRTLCTAYMI